MLALWNARYPQWTMRSVRGFQGEFRRAEASLTGQAFGLEWFYRLQARPESRESLSWRETTAMLSRGPTDKDRRFAARELAAVQAAAREASLSFAPRVAGHRTLRRPASLREQIADELLESLPDQLPGLSESGEELDPRETAIEYVRWLVGLDLAQLPERGPGETRIDYPGVRRVQ